MSISTKTGDTGMTSLFDGTRVKKSDLRIEILGTIDELSAHLGFLTSKKFEPQIIQIQKDLYLLGALLANPSSKPMPKKESTLENSLKILEQNLIDLESSLPPLTAFILPRGPEEAVHAHVARTICRRAERTLTHLKTPPPFSLAYLNRLSDYLFLVGRQ